MEETPYKIVRRKHNPPGRPTKITPEVETKLESVLKMGGTIVEAVTYAGIAQRTYYDRLEASESFKIRMEKAKYFADIAAKRLVVQSITKDNNLDSAKWWLEKRVFKEGTQINVNANEAKILVMPAELIQKHEISQDTEPSGSEQGEI